MGAAELEGTAEGDRLDYDNRERRRGAGRIPPWGDTWR
jgi:hypothetical protein